MTNLAAQTLTGLPPEAVYKVIETPLPDGTTIKQLFQLVRYPNGSEKWELTSERIRKFDETFTNPASAPHHWKDPQTAALTQRPEGHRETEHTIRRGGLTRIDLQRILTLNLGDERRIIENKGLDTQRVEFFKKNQAFFSTLCMMAYEHGGSWREAAQYLKPAYPDSFNSPKG